MITWLRSQFADADTAARWRAAIYALAVAVFGAIGVTGAINDEQTSAWLTLVQAGTALLAALFTPWTAGLAAMIRGVTYSLVAAVFGVLAVYGIVNSEQVTSWLSICSALIAIMSLVNVKGLTPAPLVDGAYVVTSVPESVPTPPVKKAVAKKATPVKKAAPAAKKAAPKR